MLAHCLYMKLGKERTKHISEHNRIKMLMDFPFLGYTMLGIYLLTGLICLVAGYFFLRSIFHRPKPAVASMREEKIQRDPGSRAPLHYESNRA